MKQSFLLTIFFIFISFNYSYGDELCPKSKETPPPSGAEELKIFESELTIDKSLNSVKFLEKDVIKIIKKHEHKDYSILDYEGFYIGYPNSLMLVKGTLLKQNAIIAKQELEILKLKKCKEQDISIAIKKHEDARNQFCDFLKSNEYRD